MGVVIRLSEVINRHLRNGDRVHLQDWGLMKFGIESDKVDNLQDFRFGFSNITTMIFWEQWELMGWTKYRRS